MSIIDLCIGALLMNAMPHFIMGITHTRFLGLFGFSALGNILYSLLQLVICLWLYHLKYGISTLLSNGIVLGGVCILLCFYIFGRLSVRIYKHKKLPPEQ